MVTEMISVIAKLNNRKIYFSQITLHFRSETRVIRSSHPELFLRNGVLKTLSKFTGEHPCRKVISIKLPCTFIEIALRHGCSPVNLLLIFGKPFLKNTFGWLLLVNIDLSTNSSTRLSCLTHEV